MAGTVKFTPDRRERFLTLLERGDSIEEACADVGISRPTITKWAARGRRPDAPDDGSAEFAFRLDEIREGTNEPTLSPADVVKLLEKAARNGSVQAMKLLLEQSKEKDAPKRAQEQPEAEQDPFSADPADELTKRRAQRRGA